MANTTVGCFFKGSKWFFTTDRYCRNALLAWHQHSNIKYVKGCVKVLRLLLPAWTVCNLASIMSAIIKSFHIYIHFLSYFFMFVFLTKKGPHSQEESKSYQRNENVSHEDIFHGNQLHAKSYNGLTEATSYGHRAIWHQVCLNCAGHLEWCLQAVYEGGSHCSKLYWPLN